MLCSPMEINECMSRFAAFAKDDDFIRGFRNISTKPLSASRIDEALTFIKYVRWYQNAHTRSEMALSYGVPSDELERRISNGYYTINTYFNVIVSKMIKDGDIDPERHAKRIAHIFSIEAEEVDVIRRRLRLFSIQ